MRNLSDREIQNILKLKLNQPINPINFRQLIFKGVADGSTLTRVYNNSDLINNYVRIIKLEFAYYASSSGNWMREIAADNKIFTSNANSRYSMIRPDVRLEPLYLERNYNTTYLNILVDGNSLNLFNKGYAYDQLELDLLPQQTLANGIDVQYKTTFVKDMETLAVDSPLVLIGMFVEIINDINPLQFEQTIKDN